ncbi:hypothetical protein E2C01_057333 [Portunus trituberculatus]|uniref:Uncharacterized protein n=1 Tax=Portunus trituberculatus TaxID=210409 RepID=A0A5B7H234_PORTR|nr:hypothetical protein [Portunus trituberculatus]
MDDVNWCGRIKVDESRWMRQKGAGGTEQQEKQILNCLLAKQLCEEDSNCSAILKVIPTLCGPELVLLLLPPTTPHLPSRISYPSSHSSITTSPGCRESDACSLSRLLPDNLNLDTLAPLSPGKCDDVDADAHTHSP